MEDLEQKINSANEYNTIIIGSGAAGLNCALHLVEEGLLPSDISIITENLGGGTSFNTGSDKQTYYKLSIIGDQSDSPFNMAESYTNGGAMHGDIALTEVSNSVREFFHLVQIGVPFPHDMYGGYVGYKTDNDPKQRATSIGPLTSQKMGECLLKAVQTYRIPIINHCYVMRIIIDDSNGNPEACGVICFKTDEEFSYKNILIYKARNVIIATGGPAYLYRNSVYPPSQFGSTALGILAGCKLQNLTESQFGLASTKFRWNVSGSYMQVIPRFVSINNEGKENEFLGRYFPNFKELSKAIFLKGYQWPFNSDRIENSGSSLIDLAVYHETEFLRNKIYLDFTKNPLGYSNESLDIIPKDFLTKTNSLGEKPIERLQKLNNESIELYKNHGIDIKKDLLQIAVCNQHLNGGISGDIWWETNIKHLFAIGEINGSHGIHRPGGAALNSGQVAGLRVAQKIAKVYYNSTYFDENRFKAASQKHLKELLSELEPLEDRGGIRNEENKLSQILYNLHERMSQFACIIRPEEGLEAAFQKIEEDLRWLNRNFSIISRKKFIEFFRLKDALLTQLLFFRSIQDYHNNKGSSRGSFLISRKPLETSENERLIIPPGELAQYQFIKSQNTFKDKIQTIQLQNISVRNDINILWEKVREIPKKDDSFEVIWKKFNDRSIFK